MEVTPGAPALDDLLRHAAWVRGLAGFLVLDPSAADDAAQDVWVSALERPPRRADNVRGWLASVVRSTVSMRRRAGVRRADHEALARRGDDEVAPSAEALAERIETQRLLARKVLSLDEPYRSTVILRFYEGLSSAEIARRTETPAGTVRWRLSEALARLRGDLDKDFGGERAAWMALVLPLAPRDLAWPAAAGGAGLVQGLLAMSLATKLAVVATAAVIALALSPLGSSLFEAVDSLRPVEDVPVEVVHRPLEKDPAPSLSGEASVEASTRTALPDPVPPVPSPSASAGPLEGFRGRVFDDRGLPIEGARVALLGVGRSVASGPEGSFELPLEADAEAQVHTLRITHGAYATEELRASSAPGQMVELGDLRLKASGVIEGRVLRADGQPAEGAWVRLDRSKNRLLRGEYHAVRCRNTAARLRPDVITGGGGRFRLEGVPAGAAHLWVGSDGALATRTSSIEVLAGMVSAEVEIVLGEIDWGDFIRGRVLLPDGAPAARAVVEYRYETSTAGSGSGSLLAGTDGRFLLACQPAGPRTLRARDREAVCGPAKADRVGGGDEITLRLTELEYLELLVRGGGEVDPVVGCFDPERRARLVLPRQILPIEAGVRVPLPDEPFVIVVSAAGHEERELGPYDGRRAPRRLEVELRELPGVRGTVTAAGEPVGGARVEAFLQATARTTHQGFPVRLDPRPRASAVTRADGTYALSLRDEGRFYLRFSGEGHAATEIGPITLDPEAGRSGLDAELRAGGSIEGTLTVAGGESPAGRIVAVSRGDGHARTVRCRVDGSFRFDHLVPGRFWVGLVDEPVEGRSETHWGGEPFDEKRIPWNCIVREGEATRFDLGEDPADAVVVTGRLVIDGEPAQGRHAQLVEGDGFLLEPAEAVPLDEEGGFRLVAKSTGRHRLILTGSDPRTGMLTAVLELRAGENPCPISFSTGRLEISGHVAAPGEEEMDMAIVDGGGFTALFPIVPVGNRPVVLEGLPARELELRRYQRGDDALDPLRSGTILRTATIPAGGTARIELP